MSRYTIYEMEQGTPDWLKMRAGNITASSAHKLLTRTGKRSSQIEGYAARLAAEVRTGKLIEEIDEVPAYQSHWMQRGHELEAINLHEFGEETYYGKLKTHIGFIQMDEYDIGFSPDGLTDGDIPVDAKCLSIEKHLKMLWSADAGDYYQQMQMQMYVLGAEISFLSFFHPNIEPSFFCLEIARDEEYIKKLEEAALDCLSIRDGILTRLKLRDNYLIHDES